MKKEKKNIINVQQYFNCYRACARRLLLKKIIFGEVSSKTLECFWNVRRWNVLRSSPTLNVSRLIKSMRRLLRQETPFFNCAVQCTLKPFFLFWTHVEIHA